MPAAGCRAAGDLTLGARLTPPPPRPDFPPEAGGAGAPGIGEAATELVAVDLGSNSFHMAIARAVHDVPVLVDRIREPVRLGLGLDERGELDKAARNRAIACLERFGQRIRHIPAERVRAVGTNTLRRARRSGRFLLQAERLLGHPIEVISGAEEARLIYLGAAQDLADDTGLRLVVDIGGGSTECVIGERFEALEAHSLYMGCIEWSRRHFPGGVIKKKGLDEAITSARREVQTIERRFRDLGWDRAIGSSGTIRATADVLRESGWADGTVTPAGLKKLRKTMVAAGAVKKLDLPGLKPTRAPVFPGGVAVLSAVFDGLDIERMETSFGALREGLLYDLLGRIRHEDVRERTIRILQDRYHVDRHHAARVERHAVEFLRQAAPGWGLDPAAAGRFVTWAARLHEVGLAIAYHHHQGHGAYLVANSDLPGFSRDDQRLLAAIVGGHRRRIRPPLLEELSPTRQTLALRLIVLLRLAVLANRDRGPRPPPPFRLEGRENGLLVRYPRGWLRRNPLTRQDFDQEAAYLARVGFAFEARPSEE